MNIIIPLGGKGERFSNNGYLEPKPLIPIFDKCMIEYVLDHLSVDLEDDIFIIYNTHQLDPFQFSDFIIKKYPSIHLIPIGDTKGAVETLFLGIESILYRRKFESLEGLQNTVVHKKTLILDCDTFYTQDIVSFFRDSPDNMVFYTFNQDLQPIYSYIEMDVKNKIINIQEKIKISDNANTGAYAFLDIHQLHHFCKHVLDNDITFNNEPYTSCVISEMLLFNHTFIGYELKNEQVFSLGTPKSVEKYQKNTMAFLFDLDGTLVISDDIYFEVWYQILFNYNIILDKTLFRQFIQGNNDFYILNTLLKNVQLSLKTISQLKDELFLKNIHQLKIIDGIHNFILKIKEGGHKICIVTNCNRQVAQEIVKYIGIESSVDFIISANDCTKGKPNPEPYQKAIERYHIQKEKCIIFEDSKSGLLSGKGVSPRCLIGIETIYNQKEMMNYGVDISITNYENITVDSLIQPEISLVDNHLIEWIKKSSCKNVKNIYIDDEKLKGGFIADVICFKIVTQENESFSQILKYENEQENNLSIMAKRLDLYEREYYFYTDIYKYINVRIPQFYHLLLDDNFIHKGIVLENLNEKKYKINLNLNIESIDVTLKIVDRMAKMHSKFWNKNLQKKFPQLKKSTDPIFFPFFEEFIAERNEIFKSKWFKNFNENQRSIYEDIFGNFHKIQQRFSEGNHLTFIHGDIKSPNIFYDIEKQYEPIFIDWQHCAIGKGVQDLVFFVLESFDLHNLLSVFLLIKQYYYHKLKEYGVLDYSMDEYEKDLVDAMSYIPFFTSIWFGTVPQDELIDKNFPFFLIHKMFFLLESQQLSRMSKE